MISNRIKKILEIILQTKESVNIPQISKDIGVSERTIYRELPEVTEILESNHIQLKTVSKKGIMTIGSIDDKEALLHEINAKNDVYVVDPEERADIILFDLLMEEDYIKADALAIDNGISTPTVRNDLKKIKKRIEEYDLTLDMKKGDGILIQGDRVDKNHQLCNVLMKRTEQNIILKWLDGENVYHGFLKKLEKQKYRDILMDCHKLLKNIFHKTGVGSVKLKDQEYMEIIFLLGMMIAWNQKKKSYVKIFDYKANKGSEKFALEIAALIESRFGIELSQIENDYIEIVLDSATTYNTSEFYTIRNQQLDEKFRQFITYIEEHLGIFIQKDKDFRENLYTHIDRAISRVRNGMCITNPLLNEIKKDYKELFGIVRDAVKEVFPKNFFPDDEIAYIVMYFAVALDKTMKKEFRILVVCSGGMGSSKMLAHRIEQEIPEIAVKKTVSLLGFEQENLDDYDLILATIPLYIEKERYLKISPLLNKTELIQVREEIKRHKYKTLRKITVQEKEKRHMEDGTDIQILRKMRNMLETGLEMVQDFQILTKENSENPSEDLKYILNETGEGNICAGLKKEKNNKKYFQIPTTELLYYEVKHTCDVGPKIYVCHFENTQYLETKEAYHDVIYVLYSEKSKDYETSLLNYLVGAVVDDVDLQKMIQTQNEEGIRQWIGYQIKQYTGQIFNI